MKAGFYHILRLAYSFTTSDTKPTSKFDVTMFISYVIMNYMLSVGLIIKSLFPEFAKYNFLGIAVAVGVFVCVHFIVFCFEQRAGVEEVAMMKSDRSYFKKGRSILLLILPYVLLFISIFL